MKTEDKNAILLGQINNESNFSWLNNISESNILFTNLNSNSLNLHKTNTDNINNIQKPKHKCTTPFNRDVHLNNL